ACPPSLPSVPTARATRLTSDANPLSWSTMVLMVFFSSRISPLTSTVIFLERSPRAIRGYVEEPHRLRQLDGLQPDGSGAQHRFASEVTRVAREVGTEGKLGGQAAVQLVHHAIVLMVSLSSRISPLTSTVILRERSPRATAV